MIGKLRALTSILNSRSQIASQAGITFGGSRDLFTALGYKKSLLPEDFRDRYSRNAVAGRIVEAAPQSTWRGGVELVEDEDPETETTFETAFKELDNKFNIWSILLRADILAGLGRFSVVLIGAPGELEQPLQKGANNLLYFFPFSEQDVTVATLVTDSSDERYGLPAEYKFSRLSSGNTGTRQRSVHWTRVLHVADGILDEQIYGESRLKRVWNLLDDLEKITGAGAEAFWLRAHVGYQFDVDKDTEMLEGDMTELSDEIDEFIHGLRRFVRTRGVNMQVLSSQVANFNNQVNAIMELISAGTGIPKRILSGSERGELASTQDRSNWQERIQDRRTQYAEPQIIRPLIDRFIEYGMLPKPQQYEVRWPEFQDLDDIQRADVADKLSKINKQIGDVIITPAEIRDRILGLDPLQDVEDFNDDYSREDAPIVKEEPIKEEEIVG